MSDMKTIRRIATVAINIVVAVIGVIIAYPLVWMISASFKQTTEIYQFPPTLIPNGFTFTNYARLFTDWPFGTWYINSLVIALSCTITVLFFAPLPDFGFAKVRFSVQGLQFFSFLGSIR